MRLRETLRIWGHRLKPLVVETRHFVEHMQPAPLPAPEVVQSASPLDLSERDALERIIDSRLMASALKKTFANREEYYTQQARNLLNAIPQSLDEQAKNHEMAKQYAAMAKAYGMAWAEIQKAVDG